MEFCKQVFMIFLFSGCVLLFIYTLGQQISDNDAFPKVDAHDHAASFCQNNLNPVADNRLVAGSKH